MKKIITVILCLVMVFSLNGCKKSDYDRAYEELNTNRNYEIAATLFENLGDYKDSQYWLEVSKKCINLDTIVKALIEKGVPETDRTDINNPNKVIGYSYSFAGLNLRIDSNSSDEFDANGINATISIKPTEYNNPRSNEAEKLYLEPPTYRVSCNSIFAKKQPIVFWATEAFSLKSMYTVDVASAHCTISQDISREQEFPDIEEFHSEVLFHEATFGHSIYEGAGVKDKIKDDVFYFFDCLDACLESLCGLHLKDVGYTQFEVNPVTLAEESNPVDSNESKQEPVPEISSVDKDNNQKSSAPQNEYIPITEDNLQGRWVCTNTKSSYSVDIDWFEVIFEGNTVQWTTYYKENDEIGRVQSVRKGTYQINELRPDYTELKIDVSEDYFDFVDGTRQMYSSKGSVLGISNWTGTSFKNYPFYKYVKQ